MELLGKHIFRKKRFQNYGNVDSVIRRLYRITRETRTQFISDVQRQVVDYHEEPLKYAYWKKVAHRLKKNKLLNDNGELSNEKYGYTCVINKENSNEMISDVPFEELFYIQKKENRLMKLFSYFKNKKDNTTFPCWDLSKLDNEKDRFLLWGSLEQLKAQTLHLEELLGKKVYYADRVREIEVEDENGINIYHPEYRYNHKFDRNIVFYQITHFGGGDAIKEITSEENSFNGDIYFWLFEDKIVFIRGEGRGTW